MIAMNGGVLVELIPSLIAIIGPQVLVNQRYDIDW